ncbi:MAG: ribbon-helix-helix domain-containing protein [Nitrospira sp.]|nr:ribbon-helix-helix domain-containing protein [Nitrospira sp.]
MATLTISLSDKEMRRLNNLSEREGVTMEQMVRCCIRDLIAQPDESFQITAQRVIEKNAELYRRLS